MELKRLVPYFRPYRPTVAVGLALVVVSNFFITLAPRFIQRGIDALQHPSPLAEVGTAVLLLLGTALAGGLARFEMRRALNSASRYIERDLRNDMFRHLERMPAAFYGTHPVGDLMSRSTNDLLAVRMVAGPALMYTVDTITRALLIGPAMIQISPRLALYALAPLIGLPLVMIFVGQTIHYRALAIQAQFADLTNYVHENLSGVRVVRAYRQERSEIKHFRSLNEEYAHRNVSLAYAAGAFHPLLNLLGGLGAASVLYFGGRLVVAGTVSPGAFVAFGVYLATLVWPMIALGWAINLVQRGEASMARINVLLSEVSTIVSPPRPLTLPAAAKGRSLIFEHVWFQYPGARERGYVLEDISFAVGAGRSLAIVGPIGAGKSALVDLIVRTYDPDRGRILLDGVDIRTLSLEELRREVGFVPQETFLFSATLRENILLGAPDDGRLERVSEVSQLVEALPALPQGYDTMLGERGINLSGGQKQRAAIARALARDPTIFVLDDALSAVDTQIEARILHGLRDALVGRTSVIVSHRLTAVRDADWIIVLDRGRMVEAGTHDDLIGRGGRYWELLRRQQVEEELESIAE